MKEAIKRINSNTSSCFYGTRSPSIERYAIKRNYKNETMSVKIFNLTVDSLIK